MSDLPVFDVSTMPSLLLEILIYRKPACKRLNRLWIINCRCLISMSRSDSTCLHLILGQYLEEITIFCFWRSGSNVNITQLIEILILWVDRHCSPQQGGLHHWEPHHGIYKAATCVHLAGKIRLTIYIRLRGEAVNANFVFVNGIIKNCVKGYHMDLACSLGN